MKISLSQIAPKLSRDNFNKHLEQIELSKKNGSDLIVFPELSLNGYMMMDLVFEDAYKSEELNLFKKASLEIDILLGVALRDGHKIYNSAIYFSKGKILNIHHKNVLPNYGMFQEARFFFSGNTLESFESDFGTAISVICEDLWSANIIEKIVSIKPDIVYVLSASPARVFENDGLGIEKQWDSILKTTANLSGAYVVFVNRVGFEDGLGFWGGSRVIDANSSIELKAPLFEESLVSIELSHKISQTKKYLLRIES